MSKNPSYGSDPVIFRGEKLKLYDLCKKLGCSYSSVTKLMREKGWSRQRCADFLDLVHLETEEGYVKTVSRFFVDESLYFHYEGKLWTTERYCAVYSPTWTPDAFRSVRHLRKLSLQDTFEYMNSTFRPPYSDAENDIIKANKDTDCAYIASLLKNRTPGAIYAQARSLGLLIPRKPITSLQTLSNIVKDLQEIHPAYTGTNGEDFVFAKCAICGRQLLLSFSAARVYQHSDRSCATYEVPSGCVIYTSHGK